MRMSNKGILNCSTRLPHGRIQRGGTGDPDPLPLKNYRNTGFHCNAGPDLLKNHKAAKPGFNVGPSSARQPNAI